VTKVAHLAASCAPLLVVSLAACASPGTAREGPPDIPPQIDRAHLHFAETELGVGDTAPDFTLRAENARSQVTLSDLRGKPVVLVFGSYT